MISKITGYLLRQGEAGSFSRSLRVVDGLRSWMSAVADRKVPGLLITLLAVDSVLILFHLLHTFTYRLPDPAFSLVQDRGYGELFQYLKLLGITALLVALVRKHRAPVYFHWIALFSYFLLDDALLIHEQVGKWLAAGWGLPPMFSAQGFHLGELLFFALLGIFFLVTLSATYPRSDSEAKDLSQDLILLAVGLAVFGVGLDLIQEMVASPWLRAALGTLEDGGEIIIVSVTTWHVFGRTRQVLQWEERSRAWSVTATQGAALFVLFLISLGFVQYGTSGLAGNDGYYHAKMGFLVRQQGLKPPAPRLPFTILNEASFYDHHLLYHVYLSLFASTDPALDGGVGLTENVKIASVLLPALAFIAIWWLLRGQSVRWPALWTLSLLALSGPFLYRMSMPRAQAASLLVLAVAFHWLLKGRFHWLVPLGFAYVWLFNGFPLLLVMAGTFFVAGWITERRVVWSVLIYPSVGVLLGLVINPYFPQNLVFLGKHLLPKVGKLVTPVGSEWYPYATADLIQNTGLVLGLLLVAVLPLVLRKVPVGKATLTALLLASVFGLMFLRSRRFVEYFPAFVLIFAAFSLSEWLDQWHTRPPRSRRWLAFGVVFILCLSSILTIRSARVSMAQSPPADQYAAATLWLKAYSEPGSRIFQTDWDDFPRLFFYDSDQEYTIGLDPTFMQLDDPERFARWVRITQGEHLPISDAIRDEFGSDFVFSDLDHAEFLRQATDDPGLKEIYRDEYAVIFETVEPETE